MRRKIIRTAGLLLALLLCACSGPEAETIPGALTETMGVVSTPTGGGAPAVPEGVRVDTLDRFVAAIAPGVTLVIPERGITLSVPYAEAGISPYDQDPPEFESDYVRWDHGGTGWQMTIHDVNGLTLVGENGNGLLLSLDENAFVLGFENCDDLTLEGLTAGHEVPGYCTGGVFRVNDSRRMTMTDMRMYGCGTEGLAMANVKDARIENCDIYACTFNLMTLSNCEDITFVGTTFRDTGEFDMVYIYESTDILFEDCAFRDNFSGDYTWPCAFFTGRGNGGIAVRRSQFEGNALDMLDNGLGVIFEDCTFTGNLFDDGGFFDDGRWIPFVDGETGAESLPVYNNGGHYVEFGGLTYFRKYNADAYEESALWGDFALLPGAASILMSIDAAGTMRPVCSDNGIGGIFIYQGPYGEKRFILSSHVTDELTTAQEIYTMNLDGSDYRNLGHGAAFAVDDRRGLIITQTYRGGVDTVHCLTGERRTLVEAYHTPLFYDASQGMLYCADVSGGWNPSLCVFDVRTGEARVLLSDDMPGSEGLYGEDAGGFDYRTFRHEGEFMWVSAGRYAGTLNALQYGVLVRIHLPSGEFYVYEDITPEDWYQEYEVFTFQEDSPFSGNPSYDALGGYWMTSAAGLTPLLMADDLIGIDMVHGAYYGPEDFVDLVDMEVSGRYLYFTRVSGPRDERADIGWRWGYNRREGRVYRVDLGGIEWQIELLYTN